MTAARRPDGSQVEAALPFRVANMWAVASPWLETAKRKADVGAAEVLVLERAASGGEEAASDLLGDLTVDEVVLYSLSHALDDLRPVAAVEDLDARRANERVAACVGEGIFVTTSASSRGGHTLWVLEAAAVVDQTPTALLRAQHQGFFVDQSVSTAEVIGDRTLLPTDHNGSSHNDNNWDSVASELSDANSAFDGDASARRQLPAPELAARRHVLPPSLALTTHRASRGFLTTAADATPVVVVLAGKRLIAVRRGDFGTVAFELEGVEDAVPVMSTLVGDCVVVLTVGRTLELWHGDFRVARLGLPASPPPPPSTLGGGPREKPARLRDAIGDRFSVDFSNGGDTLRVETSLRPEDSPCTAAALDALDAAFRASKRRALALRAAVLAAAAELRKAHLAGALGPAPPSDVEWHALSLALLDDRHPDGAVIVVDPDDANDDDDDDDAAWRALLGSDFHRGYSATHHATVAASPLSALTVVAEAAGPPPLAAATAGARGRARVRRGRSSRDAAALAAIDSALGLCGISRADYDRRLVVAALHCLCENAKLSTLTWGYVEPVARLLCDLSTNAAELRHHALVLGLESKDAPPSQEEDAGGVTDVFRWFSRVIRRRPQGLLCGPLPKDLFDDDDLAQGGPFQRTVALRAFYRTLFASEADEDLAAQQLVVAMAQAGFGLEELATVPAGVAAPLHDALQRCGSAPPEGWAADAYELVGRHDMAMLVRDAASAGGAAQKAHHHYHHHHHHQHPGGAGEVGAVDDGVEEFQGDEDGLRLVEAASLLRFGDDCRVHEVCRLLRASRPTSFRVDRPPEMSDHDFEQKKQHKLLLHCTRACATTAGRAMLTLGSLAPLRTLAEPLPVPRISLCGRSPPSNAVVALDASTPAADALAVWPNFHNGVAAGLRLRPSTTAAAPAPASSDEERKIHGGGGGEVTRTWIAYNRPDAPSPAHGGLLFALGLQQHLGALAMTDIYEYLTLGHDPTTVGVLLGMAASKRGTADGAVSKMLCLHIPALLPQPFAEMEVSAAAQAAAMMGVGLLYCGTAHRLMAEFLLGEISRKAPCDRSRDREAYALSAGLALGMVTLGRGATHSGLGDLRIAQRLHRAIAGGRFDADDNTAASARRRNTKNKNGGGDSLAATAAAGMTTVAASLSSSSAASLNQQPSDQVRCSRVREGDYINTDMTAPGAILALGLYFLQTNSASAAARLALPDTHVLLDTVRPDFLMLRVIARGLILWDAVEPTDAWVQDQLPAVVKRAVANLIARSSNEKQRRQAPNNFDFGGETPRGTTTAAGARTRKKNKQLVKGPPPIGNSDSDDDARPIDRDTVLQANANVVAGACFALGLRFAGTACPAAERTLKRHLAHFQQVRDDDGSAAATRAVRPDRPTVEMCLGAVAISLALVMAGTGDLASLRVLRELRWRVDDQVTYGGHMAIHAAIGLLFLGGGRASLRRDPPAIAALVAAFSPRYPKGADDNQYHLQALRHLWVVAVDWRGLDAVDVDSKCVVPVPLEIELRPGADSARGFFLADAPPGSSNNNNDNDIDKDVVLLRAIAPCLLPPLGDVHRISVASDRYYASTLHPRTNVAHAVALRRLRFFVKRRAGHLSYAGDPAALRSRLLRQAQQQEKHDGGGGQEAAASTTSASSRMLAPWIGPPKLSSSSNSATIPGGLSGSAEVLASYTEDPVLLAFARHFCDDDLAVSAVWGAQATSALGGAPASIESWCARTLYECVARDKQEILMLYVGLQHAALTIKDSASASVAWSLRLILEYFSRPTARPAHARLLRPDFVEAIRVHLDLALSNLDATGDDNIGDPDHAARLRACAAILRPVFEPDLS